MMSKVLHTDLLRTGATAAATRSAVPTLAAVVAAVLLAAPAPPARAQLCNVPAGVPTVQLAVSNPSCAQIVLAAGSYDESVVVARTVTITGPGATTTELGRPLVVTGAGTALAAGGFAIDVGGACYRAPVTVKNGATLVVTPGGVLPVRADSLPSIPCPLFDDGFESATPHAWSAAVP